MTRLLRHCLLLAVIAAPLRAEVPRVVADIAPVHGLVSQVMAGVGEPALLMPQGSDPHGYALRPSDARALSEADLVVWIGPELTPSLARSVETLGDGASALPLLDVPGTRLLDFREEAGFEHDHHAHEHDTHDHGHDHGDVDPHAWLDPQNALVWVDAIAAALAARDPDNAGTYRDNAAAVRATLAQTEDRIAGALAGLEGVPVVVFHDAYQYFESRFGIGPVAPLSLADGASPGAARLAGIRDAIAHTGARCAVIEAQNDRDLVSAVFEGGAPAIGVIDTLGLAPGPDYYTAMLDETARAFAACAE